jgi:hypothetical protein
VVLASVAAATGGFGISLFARLVPDLRAGFVIGFAGPALGSLSEGIGLRPAMLPGLWLHPPAAPRGNGRNAAAVLGSRR